jgi:hypothetical protein
MLQRPNKGWLQQRSRVTVARFNAPSSNNNQLNSRCGDRDMLEYVAYAVLGVVMICGLLYVTLSPEVEKTSKSEPPNHKQ